jgi:hypothetical protein
MEARMVGRSLAYVAVVACASAAGLGVCHAQSQTQTRAVIELFTSQGCSSCPAADRLMGELAKDPSLVSISLPIDYWDYLGWRDTLADPRNSARQRAYSKVRADREVYTPQVVVNGSFHVLGSDRAAIERMIAKSRQNTAALSMPVTLSATGGRLTATLLGDGRAPAAEVWVVSLAKSVTVSIKRGENKGKSITYHNVARKWHKLLTADGKTWSVPLQEINGADVTSAAVLVQSGTYERPGLILGAAQAALH